MKFYLTSLLFFIFLFSACQNDGKQSSTYGTKQNIVDEKWIISSEGIGPLAVGKKLDAEIPLQDSRLRKFNASSKSGDEEVSQGIVYSYQREGKNLIAAQTDANDIIKSISVYSDEYMTKEGAHSGMTLWDIMRIYPSHTIWYEYKSSMFAITSPTIEEVKFIINNQGFKGDRKKLARNTRDVLVFEDFDPLAEISEVRFD